MAISFIGQAASAGTTVTLPAHQAGDLIVVFAYRNAITSPSLPSGFTNLSTQSANANSHRIGYKFAASSSETSGTWTSASQVNAAVYRGVWAIGGASGTTSATGTSQSIVGIGTMQVTDSTSWAVSVQGSKQITSTSTPAGTTIRGTTNTDGTSTTSTTFWDSNGGVASWAAHSNTLGATSVTSSSSFELVDAGSLVQVKQQARTTAAASQTAVWNANTTSGNLIVVQVANDSGNANTVSGIADSQSNTYTKILSRADGSFSALDLWYAYNITGGTTPTVTVSFTGGSFRAGIILLEYSGFGAGDPLDQSTSTSGTSLAPNSGATATTTQASELVIGVAETSDGANAYTRGTGYGATRSTALTSVLDMGVEYKTVAATGTQVGNFTVTTSSNWAAGVATFKIGGGVTTLNGAATLAASSSISASASVMSVGSATLAGSSSLSASGVVTRFPTASIAALSTLAAAGTIIILGSTATLTGSSSLSSAAAIVSIVPASTLPASSSLSVAGISYLATATLPASSTLTSAAVTTRFATASITASSSITASAVTTRSSSATLTASSTLAASANQTLLEQASLTGSSSLTATALVQKNATSTLVGSSSLTSTAVATLSGASSIAGSSGLSAASTQMVNGSATLVSTSNMTVAANTTAQVALSGASSLTAVATNITTPKEYLTVVLSDPIGSVDLLDASGVVTLSDSLGSAELSSPVQTIELSSNIITVTLSQPTATAIIQ